MKYRCTYCGKNSTDMNILCQRVECSYRNVTNVINIGDYVNDFRIVSLIGTLRHATLYKAQINETFVFIKMSRFDLDTYQASNGETRMRSESGEYLKVEAQYLYDLRDKDESSVVKWYPPYTSEQIPNQNDIYGKIVIEDKLFYYIIFEYIEDTIFLQELLEEYPQLSPNQVTWIIAEIAQTLIRLNTRLNINGNAYHHLALSPYRIMVRKDNDGRWRPIFIDLGIMKHIIDIAAKDEGNQDPTTYMWWLLQYIHPSYIAPKLYTSQSGTTLSGIAIDVFGLGILAYEMFAGRPVFPYKNMNITMIRDLQKNHQISKIMRDDLPRELTGFVQNIVEENHNSIRVTLESVVDMMHSVYGVIPVETEKRGLIYISPRVQRTALALALVIVLVLVALIVIPDLVTIANAPN